MPPITMLIKPASSLCNMRCKYCFYADVTDHREVKSYGIMSHALLETMVKRALDEAEGLCSFSFQGGEPTLAGLDYFRLLIDLQKKYNTKHLQIRNAIQTNGYIIDEEWAKFFAENHFLVGLSVDGYRELHDSMRIDGAGEGTYARIMKTAALFDRYHVEYNVLCVVNNLVARHPQKVYNALKKFGYIQFIPCIDGFDGEKQLYSLDGKRYAEFLKTTFDCYYQDFMSGHFVSVRNFDNYVSMLCGQPPEACGMSGFCTCYFVIEGDGSVYPCDFYVLDEFRLGNVATDSFADMRGSEQAKRFTEPSTAVHAQCDGCQWYPICRGGCRRDREPFADGKPDINVHCEAYKAFFPYAIERLQQIAQICMRGPQRR